MSQVSEAAPTEKRTVLRRLALSLVIGGALAWLLIRGGLPIVPSAELLEHVRPWGAAGFMGCLLVVHLLRALRWRHLLRPIADVPVRTVLITAWMGFAAVLYLPLRAGEVVRPWFVARRSAVKGWEAAGTVAGERILDGLVISLGLFAGLMVTTPIDPLPDHVGDLPLPVASVAPAAYAALAMFFAALLAMLLFYFQRELGVRLVRVTIGLVSDRLALRAANVVERVASGLRFLPSAKNLAPFVAETLVYWGVNGCALWLLAQGCGLTTIGPGEAFVVMGCIGIGILVPAGPGFFGAYQLSVYIALAMYVPPDVIASRGSAFVFVSYLCQLVLHAGGGAVALLLDRGARNLAEAGPSA